MVITSKADLLDPRPEMWDLVKEAEQEWDREGREGDPELPLLYDHEGRITMSALEFVGMDALRLEIVNRCKAQRLEDPMSLPEGWYRNDA